MELLLWIFFYDPKWFFFSKASIKSFKFSWFIPLLIHLIFVSYCCYVLFITKFRNKHHLIIINDLFNECGTYLKLWIYSRIFFSVFIALNLLHFKFSIDKIEHKEKSFFNNAISIFPGLQKNTEHYNYWIIRKSINKSSGISLLLLGIISFLWSFSMINFTYMENKFQGCEYQLILTINLISILIFLSNIPILILLFFKILLKVNSYFCSYLCPKMLIWFSRLYNHNLEKFEMENFKE